MEGGLLEYAGPDAGARCGDVSVGSLDPVLWEHTLAGGVPVTWSPSQVLSHVLATLSDKKQIKCFPILFFHYTFEI